MLFISFFSSDITSSKNPTPLCQPMSAFSLPPSPLCHPLSGFALPSFPLCQPLSGFWKSPPSGRWHNLWTTPYLSYDTMMICVPVLGDEQLQFPWRVILGDFCFWFKLVSANPPNSKTLNQKRELLLRFSRLVVWQKKCLGFDNECLAEGHTEAAMCVKW